MSGYQIIFNSVIVVYFKAVLSVICKKKKKNVPVYLNIFAHNILLSLIGRFTKNESKSFVILVSLC